MCMYVCIFVCMYNSDYRKLDEWKLLMTDDLSSQIWFDSSEDSEEDREEEYTNELVDVSSELTEKE